jgi:hypothetical protein
VQQIPLAGAGGGAATAGTGLGGDHSKRRLDGGKRAVQLELRGLVGEKAKATPDSVGAGDTKLIIRVHCCP